MEIAGVENLFAALREKRLLSLALKLVAGPRTPLELIDEKDAAADIGGAGAPSPRGCRRSCGGSVEFFDPERYNAAALGAGECSLRHDRARRVGWSRSVSTGAITQVLDELDLPSAPLIEVRASTIQGRYRGFSPVGGAASEAGHRRARCSKRPRSDGRSTMLPPVLDGATETALPRSAEGRVHRGAAWVWSLHRPPPRFGLRTEYW